MATGFMLIPYGREGMVLFFLTTFVAAIGMTNGLIAGLGLTLLIYFFLGSALFWMSFTGTSLVEMSMPFLIIFIWIVILLLMSLITGRFSTIIKNLAKENDRLQEQLRTLVAVDPMTGFDNQERMFLELELEYNRSKRYGDTFSFLLIKIENLDEFRKLYGEIEYEQVLQHITKNIYGLTRLSDQKFRPEQSVFALLLSNTPIKDVHIIIEKLDKILRVYQLRNKKYITLTCTYGSAEFMEDVSDPRKFYELVKDQVETHAS